MRTRLAAFFLATMMLLAFAGVAGAAHNGNNKAELTGTGDPDATGQAIVNYREGTGCAGRLLYPQQNSGTLAEGLPENQAGWSKRPAQAP